MNSHEDFKVVLGGGILSGTRLLKGVLCLCNCGRFGSESKCINLLMSIKVMVLMKFKERHCSSVNLFSFQ